MNKEELTHCVQFIKYMMNQYEQELINGDFYKLHNDEEIRAISKLALNAQITLSNIKAKRI